MSLPQVLNRYKLQPGDEGVYIGRPSKWQNPFPVSAALPRGACVEKYNAWLLTQPALMEDAKRELKGKNLICFCAPLRCHGDTLFALANGSFEGPVPFEHYRNGQPLSTSGYLRTRRGVKLSMATLPTMDDLMLFYSDSLTPYANPLQGETVYRVEFTVQDPLVLLGHSAPLETALAKKRPLIMKNHHDALVCVYKDPTYFYARQGALLNPKQQITSITRIDH